MIPTTLGVCFINHKNYRLFWKINYLPQTGTFRVKSVNKIQKMLPLHEVHSQEQRKNFHCLSTFWPFVFFECNFHLKSGQSVGWCCKFFLLKQISCYSSARWTFVLLSQFLTTLQPVHMVIWNYCQYNGSVSFQVSWTYSSPESSKALCLLVSKWPSNGNEWQVGLFQPKRVKLDSKRKLFIVSRQRRCTNRLFCISYIVDLL